MLKRGKTCWPTLLLLCFAALFLTSCTTLGPDFTALEAPEQAVWLQNEPEQIDTGKADLSRWWEGFNDPVLNKLVATAHLQNLSLQSAGLRVLEARARLGLVVGYQFPQKQGAMASWNKLRTSEAVINGTNLPNASSEFYVVGFDAAWELDMWGRFRRGVEAANAGLFASYASYDNVLVSLTAEVANVYINIRTFEKRLDNARKNVALQQRGFDITQVRFKNASITELDVRQAETLLMATKALIPSLEKGIAQYKNALAFLLGMPPLELNSILERSGVIPKPPTKIITGIPADLIRRRPDIQQAELMAAAQSAEIGIARADLFPSFYLSGAIGLSAESFSDLGTSAAGFGFLSPGFSWKILNYGRITNNVRVQDARFQQAVTNYKNTVLAAYREVEDAMVDYLRSHEEVGFLDLGVKASRRSVELALIQYRDGVIDYTPVLNTQAALVRNQDRLNVGRGAIALGLVGIYKALGGGWESRIGYEVVDQETKALMAERTNWGNLLGETPLPATNDPPPSPMPPYSLGK